MKTAAILVARLIFGFVFAMGAAFKFVFIGMDATAAEIAAAGFPVPPLLAWVAAFFETALAICFLTGLYFTEAATVAIAYVLFLAFSFHGPERFGEESDGVRLLRQSLHFRCRTAVRSGAWAGRQASRALAQDLTKKGDTTWPIN